VANRRQMRPRTQGAGKFRVLAGLFEKKM
jgi:hypothetical protein